MIMLQFRGVLKKELVYQQQYVTRAAHFLFVELLSPIGTGFPFVFVIHFSLPRLFLWSGEYFKC
ncbi:hypothetical protein [Bacillus thuringiensis]